jgi:hypothetical protein
MAAMINAKASRSTQGRIVRADDLACQTGAMTRDGRPGRAIGIVLGKVVPVTRKRRGYLEPASHAVTRKMATGGTEKGPAC